MKKHFLLLFFTSVMLANTAINAQDVIKTQTGEEIKARLLKLTRKGATYQTFGDPEFSTYTLPYEELSAIQKEGDKKPVYFNHNLPRAFLGLSGGPSIPLGSLALSDFKNTKAQPGFAKFGYSMQFNAGFYIVKKIGICISVGTYVNDFRFDKYAQTINPSGDPTIFVTSSNGTSTGKKNGDSQWRFNHFLIGPMYSFKLSKRATIDLKAKAGVISTSRPSIFIQYNQTTGSTTDFTDIIYRGRSKTDFAYSFGTSLRYALSKRIAFYIAVDYLHNKQDLETDVEIRVNNSSGTSTNTASTNYKFSSLNASAGFVFQFKRKGNKFE